VTVHRLTASVSGDVDACYVCDPALMTAHGVVLLRAGKDLRRNEVLALPPLLDSLGVAILGTVVEPGSVDGGDCVWLDAKTLAIGTGFRSNPEGIAQVSALLPDVTVLSIPLPLEGGPDACFHLGSIVSLLDEQLALVHMPLAPSILLDALQARGFECLTCPPGEFDNQACNVLCTGPSRVMMAEGNPETASLLQAHGVHVTTLSGAELMTLGTGGPTCLVLPLERS
jgi:N-dimethylarginine dimethylaminohydrolase